MRRLIGMVIGALVLTVLAHGSVWGGAKDGKMRWSHQKTGMCKWEKALVVPPAKGKQPGILQLKITYKAKELAEFFIIGDGDTDLDLVIKDAKGNVVAKDVDPPANMGGGSDMCVCRWMPAEEQEYTIIIINSDPEVNIVTAGSN